MIVSGATTVTDSITGNSFIMVINEALYYGKKLDHSLINPNELRCYEKWFWITLLTRIGTFASKWVMVKRLI